MVQKARHTSCGRCHSPGKMPHTWSRENGAASHLCIPRIDEDAHMMKQQLAVVPDGAVTRTGQQEMARSGGCCSLRKVAPTHWRRHLCQGDLWNKEILLAEEVIRSHADALRVGSTVCVHA